MDDFLDSVKPILFSAIIILFLWSVPDLFDTIKENKIALERQQLPLIKESLKSYLFTPDEVSECVIHEMEKNIDQMLCKVLQQLQDTFDAYYENKSQDIEINRTVVEQLSPKDPFGGNN